MATATTKYNSCKLKFGDPWVKNTKSVWVYGIGKDMFAAPGCRKIQGAEAVAVLTAGLNWFTSQGDAKTASKYAASVKFALDNPEKDVPNPIYNAKLKEFRPYDFAQCMA